MEWVLICKPRWKDPTFNHPPDPHLKNEEPPKTKPHGTQVKERSAQQNPILKPNKANRSQNLPISMENMKKGYLSWTHGGFKCRETVVEGTQNGDDVVCDGLTLLQRLSHHRRLFTQHIHTCHCNSHLLLLISSSPFFFKFCLRKP